MKFSVIIPSWNEGRSIVASLKRLRGITNKDRVEIIVVDGGSEDDTARQARPYADKVVPLGGANRGAQLHKGALAATGDILFFLHADTQAPGDWMEALEKFWTSDEGKNAAATVFSVRYSNQLKFKLVAWGQNLRVRLRQIAYGDAGFSTTRENYEKIGGFPEIPLMEDVVFSKRLQKIGKIALLPEPIRPAARRLYKVGPIRNSIRNFILRTRFALGESPESIWSRYYSQRIKEAPGISDGEKILKAAVRGRAD